MRPFDRAQRAIAEWDHHWSISAGSIQLTANIKREIDAAIQEDLECLAAWFLEQERDKITFNGGLAAAVTLHHDSTATSDGK